MSVSEAAAVPAAREGDRERLAIAVLLVVAAGLRLAALGRQSFWYDEAVSVELARHSLADLLSGRVRDLGNPPLYPALLHLWMQLFGDGDTAVRALSAVFGVATVPLALAVGRRLLGDLAGFAGAVLLAVSPFHLQMAQEARTYTLVTFLGVASVYALLRARERPERWGFWLLHAAMTAAMMLSHYFSLFLALAQALFLLIADRRRTVLLRATMSFVLAAVGFSFWLPALFSQLGVQGNLARSAESWHLHFAATPLVFGVGTSLVWKDNATLVRLVIAVLAMFAFGAAVMTGLWRGRRDREGVLLALWLALPIVLPALISVAANPLYNTRYVILGSVPFLLLAGAGLTAMPKRGRLMATAVLGVAVLAAQLSYYTGQSKHDWRGAVAWVEASAAPGDLVLIDTDFNETSYARYARADVPRLRLLSGPGADRVWGTSAAGAPTADITDRVLDARRVWLVLSDVPEETAARDRGFFKAWRRGAAAQFRGIEVERYERPERR